ncbi:MAG: NAD(P)-binding domain-containing protein, partial [Acidobacteriia bacterium]|nr:NAD(P)-binding domain-containing protein [Terriglobia bacterium]
MLPTMAGKPTIAIVGPGRLGSALARKLSRAGYTISEIVARNTSASLRRASGLAKSVRARSSTGATARLDADLVWFCVPDKEITL